MVPSLLQATIIGGVTWILWRFFRPIVVESPLDNIPGPPSRSFLYGEPRVAFSLYAHRPIVPVGNLIHLLSKGGWEFVQDLTDSYPGVVKLRGLFGVGRKYPRVSSVRCAHIPPSIVCCTSLTPWRCTAWSSRTSMSSQSPAGSSSEFISFRQKVDG